MKKFVLTLLFATLTAGALAGCGGTSTTTTSGTAPKADSSYLQKIKDRGKLIVGVFTDKPPFGMVDDKGNNTGLEIDLSKRFAKDLLGDENKLEFVTVEPASRIPFLQSDKVDIIMANMTVTDERKQVVDFTNPHMKVVTQLLVSDTSGIKSLDDIAGKNVIVTKGTTADVFLTKNRTDVKLTKFEKNTESLQALKDGRGDAYAQDNFILYAWARKNPGFHVLPDKLEKEAPIAPAVKKDNTELRDWVNQELEALGKEQFMHKLYDKYVKDELGPDANPDEIIVEGGVWK